MPEHQTAWGDAGTLCRSVKDGNAQLDYDIGVGAARAAACYSESVAQSGGRWPHPYNFGFEGGNDFGWVTLAGWETAAQM